VSERSTRRSVPRAASAPSSSYPCSHIHATWHVCCLPELPACCKTKQNKGTSWAALLLTVAKRGRHTLQMPNVCNAEDQCSTATAPVGRRRWSTSYTPACLTARTSKFQQRARFRDSSGSLASGARSASVSAAQPEVSTCDRNFYNMADDMWPLQVLQVGASLDKDLHRSHQLTPSPA
jgi:hypothetical protein